MKILKKVKLAPWVSYRIGGPAKFFVIPEKVSDVAKTFQFAKEKNLPVFVLGSGTNLLIPDAGLNAVVLFMGPRAVTRVQIKKKSRAQITICVPAWMSKVELLDWSLKNGWSGLEFSAGIPGTLGGAVFMNAGTKWGSYSECLVSVEFFHPAKGYYEVPAKKLGLKYRGHGEGLFDGQTVVTRVILRLKKDVAQKSRKLVDQILGERGLKQPLEFPNCGSVFKNPPNSDRGAGRLIEACGLKGLTIGKAQISKQHANFFQNLGGAKAKDVLALIQAAQKKVFQEFQIHIEPEVIFAESTF